MLEIKIDEDEKVLNTQVIDVKEGYNATDG